MDVPEFVRFLVYSLNLSFTHSAVKYTADVGGNHMLSTFCDGIKRRELLKAGTLAGLGLADFLRLQDAQACSGNDSSLKKDINCLFI